MMNPEHVKKHSFCKWELLDLVHEIDRSVIALNYVAHSDGEETVTIVFNTSAGDVYRPVNVTGDSLSALAIDVLKNL